MEITTTITCHSCSTNLEIEWQGLPNESDVASNLARMGWTIDCCPDCKEGEVV